MASSQCRPYQFRPVEGDVGDRELPHGIARRPCRALRGLRSPSHRLQQLPQPALPEVPGRRGEEARRPRGRTAARAYYHVVFTLPAAIADIAYQNKAVIYDLLFKASAETLITIAADPKHLGARIGITVRAAHLGIGADPSSTRPHDRAGRRHLPGWRALDSLPAGLFPAGAGAVAPVPPAVSGKLAAAHAAGRLHFFGALASLADPGAFAQLSSPAAQGRLGGLCQDVLSAARRPCSPICRATPTASPSPMAACWPTMKTASLQLEGLPRQGTAHGKVMTLADRRVHPPLPHPCPAERLPSHPPLRLACQRRPRRNIARARELLAVEVASRRDEPSEDLGQPATYLALPCPCCGGRLIVIETFQCERARAAPRMVKSGSTRHDRLGFVAPLHRNSRTPSNVRRRRRNSAFDAPKAGPEPDDGKKYHCDPREERNFQTVQHQKSFSTASNAGRALRQRPLASLKSP